MVDNKILETWKNFLSPDIQRSRLISASIFIATFECLKEAIIDRARGIFWRGFDESGEIFDPRYRSEVLSRNPSPVHASLDWLREKGAIDASDILIFGEIKNCRNRIAHELLTMLSVAGLAADFEQRFGDLSTLLRKIETWWIMNMEDVDHNLKESDIIPGRLLTLELLCRIGLNGDRSFFDELEKHWNTEHLQNRNENATMEANG